jgi:hypothetical protein
VRKDWWRGGKDRPMTLMWKVQEKNVKWKWSERDEIRAMTLNKDL